MKMINTLPERMSVLILCPDGDTTEKTAGALVEMGYGDRDALNEENAGPQLRITDEEQCDFFMTYESKYYETKN